MGNVFGQEAPNPGAPLILEEHGSVQNLRSRFRRSICRTALRRIIERRGSTAEVTAAVVAAGVGATDAGGFAALHLAVVYGWLELVQALAEAGGPAAVNAASADGYTPLHLAALCRRPAHARALLACGADVRHRSRRGASALHFAAQGPGNLDTLQALLADPSCTPALVRQRGHRHRSALLLAVLAHGEPRVVRGLLAAGADASETTPAMAHVSLLHSCAHLGRVEAMRVLIEAGAEVDCAAADGITVLQECFVTPASRRLSEATQRRMFRMLVEAGADVNAVMPHTNFTVLHFAMASCSDEATAELLAECGVDASIAVNRPVTTGNDGAAAANSMLHLAAMRGWVRTVERLVAAGADLSLRNKDGMQPLHAAVLEGQAGAVAALLRAGADPRAPCPDCYPSLAGWRRQRSMRVMEAVLQAGAGPEALPALLDLFGGDPMAGGAPVLSAVDLACCVARHIPCLEAFVEAGVLPSQQALELGAAAVPMLRTVVERPMWTPELHRRLPPRFHAAARQLALCFSRPPRAADGRRVALAPDAVAAVLRAAAFPLSGWASPAWLAAQRVAEPPPRPAAADQPAQPAQQAQLPQQVHLHLGPEMVAPGQLPAFLQGVLQAVQQQMGGGGGGGQPHVVVVGQPPGWAPPGGGGAQPPGAPPGMHMLQHHHVQQGGQQLHVMQFALELPFPVNLGGGAPPGGGAAAPAPPPDLALLLEGLLGGGAAMPGLPPGLQAAFQQGFFQAMDAEDEDSSDGELSSDSDDDAPDWDGSADAAEAQQAAAPAAPPAAQQSAAPGVSGGPGGAADDGAGPSQPCKRPGSASCRYNLRSKRATQD